MTWLHHLRELERIAFGDVEVQTIDQAWPLLRDWMENYDIVTSWITAIIRAYPNDRTSLTLFRALELAKSLLWGLHSARFGAYHACLRELRFTLDAMLRSFAAYRRDPDVGPPGAEDLLLQVGKPGFATVAKESQLRHEENLRALHDDLSKYAHGTARELDPALQGNVYPWIIFTFDEALLETARILTNRTVDACLYILLSRFPKACFLIETSALESMETPDEKLALSFYKAYMSESIAPSTST